MTKWAFIYTLDDSSTERRIDTIGSAINNRVPVGAVFFGVEASAGLSRIFPERRS